jgi:hypothetical protein
MMQSQLDAQQVVHPLSCVPVARQPRGVFDMLVQGNAAWLSWR